MHWGCLLAAILVLFQTVLAAGLEFPYSVYVNSADVYVRSGPGRNYYPTDKLAKGERIEVYRHDPGGWYAIRPPRQSFSWVSSRHLDPRNDGLATVNSARVVARVGSAFSDVRDVIQVRMDKGELVELIESPSDDSPWCKIAPPAGEFRWVFSKYVERDLSAEDAVDRAETADGESRDAAAKRGVRLASSDVESSGSGNGGSLQATPQELRQIADRIEVDLSAMVAADVSAWSFVDLQRRAEAVLEQSQTNVERGKARVLLSKLARFEDIRQRHEAIHKKAPNLAGAGAAPARQPDPRFDGVGRLSPVVAPKAGGPQYALVDDANAVISFVTPAPGVNLRPFVDKYIGVNGQRGYMTDLQRQHISVQRVTALDVRRR